MGETASHENGPLTLRMTSKRLPAGLVQFLRRRLEQLLGFREFNVSYHGLPPHSPDEFSRTFLKGMGTTLRLEGAARETIPSTGPLLLVANHPFGMVDAMALDMLLLSVRTDSTAMAVHFWAAIPEYRDRILFVGQRDSRRQRKVSLQGWREALKWVRRGGALVVFPAGAVERFQWRSMKMGDQTWSPHVAGLARRTGAQVVPAYFHGHNSWTSRILGAIWPKLLELRLVAEANNKRGRTLRVSLGRVIGPEEIAAFTSDDEAVGFLRTEMEKLAR